MSIVAVKFEQDYITIAADSGDIWGDTVTVDPGNKLWKITPLLFVGAVGPSSVGTMMKHYLTAHIPQDNTETEWLKFAKDFRRYCIEHGLDSTVASFLVVYDGLVWRINGMHVVEIKTFDAIGAGRPYALAALQLGHDVEDAVNVACDLCIQCVGFPVAALVMARQENSDACR
jgi:ATP-dependent protease HslVU (ClpYQ) peptidase subunit